MSIATLALLRSGKLDAAGVRALLLDQRGAGSASSESVLAAARVTKPAVNASWSSAQAGVERGLELGILALPLSSSRYPTRLRLLQDAPAVLFVRGNLAAVAALQSVAIVGTRRATTHGLAVAQRIAAYVSEDGWSVVSGLALGIDASAHEGALQGAAPTIAVLAHGLERASPRKNGALAHRILEHGGAWVSEHPHGATASEADFVARNRIQVGLSAGSIVVEGALQSGTRTHAEFCRREARALLAVVPDGVPTQSQLPRALVGQGAIAIRSRADYPEMLDVLYASSRKLTQAA